MNEVIDSFIPWRQISKAYFHSDNSAPAPAPAPMLVPEPEPEPEQVSKPVKFAEEQNTLHEFETDDEDDEDDELEDRPRLQFGEEIQLDLEDDMKSVNTEDELDLKIENSETISLNI